MTKAEAKLPPCPVCGDEPIVSILGSPGYAANVTIEHRVYQHHLVQVAARTYQAACARWRRLAGGRK